MNNKTVTIHVFLDWTISTNNITDNSLKRWQVFCINNNTYCISFDRLQRLLSHSFEIFIPMWKTNLEHTKSLAFSVFQSLLFPLFLVSMICNAQREVRVRASEWNSSGWFRVSACCCPACHSSSEPHPAKNVGPTSFLCGSLPDQWEHLCCQYWVYDSQPNSWSFIYQGITTQNCKPPSLPLAFSFFRNTQTYIYTCACCCVSFHSRTEIYIWTMCVFV